MTQQDLIKLIGLKISNETLIKHFDAAGLKQPKASTPNNSSSNINDKANNLGYYFNLEVRNEAIYPPYKEGKPAKWATFLTSVMLVGDNIRKKADTKPASFWNVTPPPTATLAEFEQFFGKPTNINEEYNTIYFSKKINDLVEIICQFSLDKKQLKALCAETAEERELISYLYFRELPASGADDHGTGMAEQNVMCMLVKWLHDHKWLTVGQNTILNADMHEILSFVRIQLKGKLWKNQLTNQDRQFANFVSDSISVEDAAGNSVKFRFQEIMLKAIGKWEEYNGFEAQYEALEAKGKTPDEYYWVSQERLLKNVPVNAENYAKFAKALDENLALYNQLMQLKVNREVFYFTD